MIAPRNRPRTPAAPVTAPPDPKFRANSERDAPKHGDQPGENRDEQCQPNRKRATQRRRFERATKESPGPEQKKQQAHAERRKQNPNSSADTEEQYGFHE